MPDPSRPMPFRERMMLWGYMAATNVLLPIGILLTLPLLLLKEKRRKTLFKRLGFQPYPSRPDTRRPLWVHALSLGETLSCVALVEALRERVQNRPILFSVSTLSAMEIASQRLRPFVDGLFYFPLDISWPVRRALRRISPALILFIETDIWPGFQRRLRAEGIPALLVNARLSPSSERACRRWSALFRPALNTFQRLYPQSDSEARRYAEVGVDPERVGPSGNLKFDLVSRPPQPVTIRTLRSRLGLEESELVLLAGSTHPGEDEAVLEAYQQIRRRMTRARLIIVPRHPQRASAVAALARTGGIAVRLFSGNNADSRWDVLVVDVMGVLSTLYHLATVSFVGGSLVAKGGQNPLEAAAGGSPVLFGPDMSDFPDIARWLLEASAAFQVDDASSLAERWMEILSDGSLRERMREAGRRVIDAHRGATERIADEVADLLGGFEDAASPPQAPVTLGRE